MSFARRYIDLSHSLDSATTDIQCTDFRWAHTPGHIDAPYHFFADEMTVEKIPIDDLIGPALVIDLSGSSQSLNDREKITWNHLRPYTHLMQPGCILLINTGWSKLHYQTSKYQDHPYITPEVASELLLKGIRVIGVDTLSPDETPSSSGDHATTDGFGFHEKFLGGGGLIAENVTNLEELIEAQKSSPGRSWIVNLVPLKFVGGDGSPVRAFAYNLD